MARKRHEFYAVNPETGETKKLSSFYEAAHTIGGTPRDWQEAMYRCGTAQGWQVYDNVESLRDRILMLENEIRLVGKLISKQ